MRSVLKIIGLFALSLLTIGVIINFTFYQSNDKEVCDKITPGMTVQQLRSMALGALKELGEFGGTVHFVIGSVMTYGCDISVQKGVVISAHYKLMD